jgi:protein tyrosine phosphatase
MSNLKFSGDKEWDTVTLPIKVNGTLTDVIFRVSMATATTRRWQCLEHAHDAYINPETGEKFEKLEYDVWHDITSPEHILFLEQKYAELGCRLAKQYREFVNQKNKN